jgi:putative two-component system response regulator
MNAMTQAASLAGSNCFEDAASAQMERLVPTSAACTASATKHCRKWPAPTTTRCCAWRCAADYRDDDTGVHIVRMGFLAEALALRLGQTEQYAAAAQAAPMHDIGKIGIPDDGAEEARAA